MTEVQKELFTLSATMTEMFSRYQYESGEAIGKAMKIRSLHNQLKMIDAEKDTTLNLLT
tara:strand:- start:3366 stop:3542 length:177 start_codon:yes stop_codon:yes gene_type:complete